MQAKLMQLYKAGHWVVFIKTRTEACIKGQDAFRFPTRGTSPRARGTYSGLLLAVQTSYPAAPDSRLPLVVVRELSATITRHKSNKHSIHKYKLNSLNYKTNKDS